MSSEAGCAAGFVVISPWPVDVVLAQFWCNSPGARPNPAADCLAAGSLVWEGLRKRHEQADLRARGVITPLRNRCLWAGLILLLLIVRTRPPAWSIES